MVAEARTTPCPTKTTFPLQQFGTSFLDLPPEIRVEIYNNFFGDTGLVLDGDYRGCHRDQHLVSRRSCEGFRQNCLPLLETCRQIRLEAKPCLQALLSVHLGAHFQADVLRHLPAFVRSTTAKVVLSRRSSPDPIKPILCTFKSLNFLEICDSNFLGTVLPILNNIDQFSALRNGRYDGIVIEDFRLWMTTAVYGDQSHHPFSRIDNNRRYRLVFHLRDSLSSWISDWECKTCTDLGLRIMQRNKAFDGLQVNVSYVSTCQPLMTPAR